MSLKDKIRHENALRIVEKNYLRFCGMDLADKFLIVNSTLFAINLGLCGFAPEVAYDISKLERVGRSRVLVYYPSKGRELLYPLPERYANVISDQDIDKINSGMKKYKIIRVIKKCSETRLRYDHKSYKWDLEIKPVFRALE